MFAIAITLLVLDLVIEPSGSPWDRVGGAWPFYLAYVVSLLTIGADWLGHASITDRLAATDFVLLQLYASAETAAPPQERRSILAVVIGYSVASSPWSRRPSPSACTARSPSSWSDRGQRCGADVMLSWVPAIRRCENR